MMRQARLSPTSKRAACPSTSVAMVLADITHGFIDARAAILDCQPANFAGLGGRPEGGPAPASWGGKGSDAIAPAHCGGRHLGERRRQPAAVTRGARTREA